MTREEFDRDWHPRTFTNCWNLLNQSDQFAIYYHMFNTVRDIPENCSPELIASTIKIAFNEAIYLLSKERSE